MSGFGIAGRGQREYGLGTARLFRGTAAEHGETVDAIQIAGGERLGREIVVCRCELLIMIIAGGRTEKEIK